MKSMGTKSDVSKLKLQIKYLPISKLVPYPKNPRKNDKAVDVVATSIQEYGFLVPILIDEGNNIIAGHTRLKAAEKLGITEVPTIMTTNLTEEQIKSFRIMDNRAGEYATWDQTLLLQELKDLQITGFDLGLTGMRETEVNRLLDSELNEPNIGNKKPKYQIMTGDIYKLGENRIICGDSTKKEIVSDLLEKEKVAMVFTDPPYGVSYSGTNNPNGRDWDIIEGDELRGDQLYELIFNAFLEIENYMKPKSSLYIFHASRNQIIFERALNEAGFQVKQQLIWHKHHVLGHSHYHWCHEPMFFCSKINEDPLFYGDRIDKTTFNELDVDKMSESEVREFLKKIQAGSTVWAFKKDKTQDYIHPTQKPVGLAKRAILNRTQFREGSVPWNKGIIGRNSHSFGRIIDDKTRKSISEGIKKAYDKKGRKSDKNRIMRKSKEYYKWRKAVFERDNFKCIRCGKNKELHPHHIKLLSKFPDLAFDLDNGETLCSECHGKEHGLDFSKLGKWIICKVCKKRFRPKSGNLKQKTCSKDCGYLFRENSKKGVKL